MAKADPDGYTLLMAIDGTLVMNPLLYSKLSYDPFKDFAPITLVAECASVIEVQRDLTANTSRNCIDDDKADPGKLNFGSGTTTAGRRALVRKAYRHELRHHSVQGQRRDRQGLLPAA